MKVYTVRIRYWKCKPPAGPPYSVGEHINIQVHNSRIIIHCQRWKRISEIWMRSKNTNYLLWLRSVVSVQKIQSSSRITSPLSRRPEPFSHSLPLPRTRVFNQTISKHHVPSTNQTEKDWKRKANMCKDVIVCCCHWDSVMLIIHLTYVVYIHTLYMGACTECILYSYTYLDFCIEWRPKDLSRFKHLVSQLER